MAVKYHRPCSKQYSYKKKMKKLVFSVLLAISIVIGATAQPYQKTNLGVKSVINSSGIEIQFYSPSIVRVLKWPEGKTFAKESLSVIKTPGTPAYKIMQQGDVLSLTTEKLQVHLNLKNGKDLVCNCCIVLHL